MKTWAEGFQLLETDALGILSFWGIGLDLSLDLDLSLQSELQHCENSRPKACYFPKSEAEVKIDL